jgi:hypothetical protein
MVPLALCCSSIACSGGEDGAPPPSQGVVVFGLTSQLVRPYFDVDRLRVTLRRGGVPLREETFARDPEDPEAFSRPRELVVEGEEGTTVAATFEPFAAGAHEPLLTRTAVTEIVGGRVVLHTVELESCCSAGRSADEIHHVAGAEPTSAIACDATSTWKAGACVERFVPPAELADYEPTWADGADPCRPPGRHTPSLDIGQGVLDYVPAESGDELQLETNAGQGAGMYHVWIAIHADAVPQKGTITQVTARVSKLDYEVPVSAVIFTLEPSDIRGCELAGLRLVATTGAPPVASMAGRSIDVTVKLTATDGTTVSATRTLRLSETSICWPSGDVVPAGECPSG